MLPSAIPSPASAVRSAKTVAATKPRCSSESDGIDSVQHGLRASGFLLENFEVRQIGVPFDEGGLRTETLDGRAVEPPYGRRDARAVRIDEAASRVVEA